MLFMYNKIISIFDAFKNIEYMLHYYFYTNNNAINIIIIIKCSTASKLDRSIVLFIIPRK